MSALIDIVVDFNWIHLICHPTSVDIDPDVGFDRGLDVDNKRGPDGSAYLFHDKKQSKPSGLAPTGDWLSLHGPKKVSKERTALAAGMFVTVWFIEETLY